MELDPTFFDQYPMDCFDDVLDFHYFNSESKLPKCFPFESLDNTVQTLSPYNTCASGFMAPKVSASSTSQLISFEPFNAPSIASDEKPKIEKMDFAYEDKSCFNYDNRANKVATTARNQTQAQDHVIAERKRREKLTQQFIALSAIVPGLKKMDKASVLGDAIKYAKQLQERVQTLEEQAAKKKGESAVLVKRSILFAEDDIRNENSDRDYDQSLPEIEARISGKDVLIRIHCDKHSGRVAKILSELEKYHLTVQSSSFLPFGNNILDITIVAQMNQEYCMAPKDLLGSLRQALRRFI